MQEFYFAGCCLRVLDENGFLVNGPLSFFKSELPCRCDAVLKVLRLPLGVFPQYDGLTCISEGMGIRIANLGGGRWLFLSEDKNNRCSIEAKDGYSSMQGYYTIDECSDKGILRRNFFELLRLAAECRLTIANSVALHASCIESDRKEQIFLQEDYPVAAIVEVRQAKGNRVRRLSAGQAFGLLAQQCLIPMWDEEAKFAVMETIRLISKKIPCYRIFCLPDAKSVALLNQVLFGGEKNYLKKEQQDMKIREGFVLKNVMDEWIVLPTGSNIRNFEGAIVLNDIAAFIWQQLEKPVSKEDLLQSVLDEYDTDEQTAAADLDTILDQLRGLEILQES